MDIQWAFNSATVMNCGWEEELRLWQQFGWRAAASSRTLDIHI
jgi:hypothetical protein